jgi:hypothetical protein
MTAESTQTVPRSRRALLAGVLGGAAAWAAAAAARVNPAEAAVGDPLLIGRDNHTGVGKGTMLDNSAGRATFRAVQHGAGAALLGYANSGAGVYAFSDSGRGVDAVAFNGIAVRGQSENNYGGWFHRLLVAGHQDLQKVSEPAAPAAGFIGGRLYIRDNGAGKGELCVRFPTGAVQVIATEP